MLFFASPSNLKMLLAENIRVSVIEILSRTMTEETRFATLARTIVPGADF